MGVYIKGMELPEAGAYICELGVIDKNTAVLTLHTPIDEPQRSYELISVPSHGRLIDANALSRELSVISARPISRGLNIIREIPTVIEAEAD